MGARGLWRSLAITAGEEFHLALRTFAGRALPASGATSIALRGMPDKSVDCIVTDPPYGIGLDYDGAYDDSVANLEVLIRDVLPEMRRVGRQGHSKKPASYDGDGLGAVLAEVLARLGHGQATCSDQG